MSDIVAIRLRRKVGRPLGSRDKSGHARRVPVDHRARSLAAWQSVAIAFGFRIRAMREERDIAASELAAAIGCTRTAIHAWENGRHFPSIPTLLLVAAALDCSMVDLMPDEAHHRAEPVRQRRIA